MQAVVAQQIENFQKFPPRQKPASFNLASEIQGAYFGRFLARPPSSLLCIAGILGSRRSERRSRASQINASDLEQVSPAQNA